MSKSSKGGLGIGGIIFWIFIGYLIFGGDDKDSKQVDVEVKNDTVITEELKKSVGNIKDNVKDIIEVTKDAIEEKTKKSGKQISDKDEKIEQAKEEKKVEEEKETPKIKPLFEDNNRIGDMKKL